jgi:hypothetical protein
MSPASRAGAGNDEPPIRAMTASARSPGEVTVGGAAGSSIRSTLSVTIASTTAEITATAVARPLPPSTAATAPGIDEASSSTLGLCTRAGLQRTEASATAASGRWATRSRGTMDPRATRRTPSSTTRPSQTTLAPTPSRPCPPPTATSQPSASFIGMVSASARTPPGSVTPGWSCHPTGGAPMDSSRVASASLASGAAPRAPAHTTTWPADHEACSCTSPGSSSSAASGAGSLGWAARGTTGARPSRTPVARRPCRVSWKSAIT